MITASRLHPRLDKRFIILAAHSRCHTNALSVPFLAWRAVGLPRVCRQVALAGCKDRKRPGRPFWWHDPRVVSNETDVRDYEEKDASRRDITVGGSTSLTTTIQKWGGNHDTWKQILMFGTEEMHSKSKRRTRKITMNNKLLQGVWVRLVQVQIQGGEICHRLTRVSNCNSP